MPITTGIESIIPSLGRIIVGSTIIAILIIAIKILIYVLIIRAICKYMANKNAEAFDYDYLAERTAEEVCKRLMIIENEQKKKTTETDEE